MKRYLTTLVATVGLCAALFVAPVGAAPSPQHLCHESGSYCAVPGTGTITVNAAMWTKSTGNWFYLLTPDGKVTSTTFKNKTVDSYYIGLTIYQIVFNGNKNVCIGASGGTVDMTPCSGGYGNLWVYTPGNIMVNVRATNNSTNGATPKVMSGYTAKAGSMWTAAIDSKDIGRQEWVFHS